MDPHSTMDESYLEWLIGLRGLGEAKARRIAERFPSFEQLRAASRDELSAVEGVTSGDIETLLGLFSDGSARDASGQLFLCPQCGSFAGTTAKSCPFCGVEFEVSADSGLSDQIDDFVAEEEAPARMCLTCGAGMGTAATKCDVCGRSYAPEEL
ncbi:MAG TPA: helix-hairpin-helix domain-containing protein, partial [Thermoplasmata archaeon]|nr:helix-hairpin-helix domain-containing protein [Thermoplasmata archaeon]